VLVCVVLLGGASAGGSSAAPDVTAAKSVSFEDVTGENPGGLDVTRVTVSNNDAGMLTFRVAVPSHPRLTEGMRFRVWIDSDAKRATGLAANGMDFFLFHEAGRTRLYRCRATLCTDGAPARTLRFAYSGGPRFKILNAEIGNAKRLRFAVEAATGILIDPATKTVDFSKAQFDDAPQRGRTWSYRLALRIKT
jgi:hypothetical protein